MGSSSKSSSKKAEATPAAPDATTAAGALPGGVTQQYYSNPLSVPTTGGLVKPVAGGIGQPMQGAGLNWYTPPAATRSGLAQVIGGNAGQDYTDNYGRGARGMSGAYGNSSKSGRSNDR